MKRALFYLGVAGLPALAQPAVQVHPDNRVTFRYTAPNARAASIEIAGTKAAPMEKDEKGVWSVTLGPLDPDIYDYTLLVDGVRTLDPTNPLIKANLLNSQSMVHVPGPASLPWEIGDVPRGQIHHHFYTSKVVGDHRDFYVYTPPGYDAKAKRRYPVLYLLHGYSDDASGWTAVGRAHVILDNLIAQGKAKPMLVVTPLGYGAPEIVTPGRFRDDGIRQRNMDRFREALLTEVIPQVESAYRAATDRESRAIAGLSMGGAESLYTGLNNLDRFAWVGAFSFGGLTEDFPRQFPNLKGPAKLRLLWISCGRDDGLVEINRKFIAWLESLGVERAWKETPGAHTWMVWRRNLAELAPLLFAK